MSQAYESEAENEYVIRGNAAVLRCKIPSFVADFVSVDSWLLDGAPVPLGNSHIVPSPALSSIQPCLSHTRWRRTTFT